MASAFARRFVVPALLVVASLAFCVLALEAVLRVAGYPHRPSRLLCYDPIIGNVCCAGVEAQPDNMYDSEGGSLPRTPIGPPSIWNALVRAVPLARPATRLTRETAQLLRELDFRGREPDNG